MDTEDARRAIRRELDRAHEIFTRHKGLTPAETRTGISDRKAAALDEISRARIIASDVRPSWAAQKITDRLDRLEAIVRSMP